MRRFSLCFSFLFALALSAWTPARAGSAGAPTSGIRLPLDIASLADNPTAVEINPAGLGLFRGVEGHYVFTQHRDAAARRDGHAFFLGANLWRSLSVAAGLQYMNHQQSALGDYGDYYKFSFGAGFSPFEQFGMGFAVHTYYSGRSDGFGDLTSVDLGLMWRPFKHLSLGVTAQDLTQPSFGGGKINRSWRLDMAFRPFTDRIHLAGGVRLEENTGNTDPMVRAAFEVVKGVMLGTTVEFRPRKDRLHLAINLSLTLNFPHLGLGYSSYISREGHDGLSVQLRLSRERYRSLVELRPRYVEVKLSGTLVERRRATLFGRDGAATVNLVLYLRRLRKDPVIKGVILKLDGFSPGMALAQELRQAIALLKKSGKNVFAYINGISTTGYYIASAADRIFMNPAGYLDLRGLSLTATFYRGLLEKVGGKAHFVRIGKYKSSPEAYTRSNMSEVARQARDSLMDSIYHTLVSDLGRDRNRSAKEMMLRINRGPFSSDQALKSGIVHEVIYEDQLNKALNRHFGRKIRIDRRYHHRRFRQLDWGSRRRIAVVVIDGIIKNGHSVDNPLFNYHFTGADTVIPLLDRLSANPRVAAIILRVDSPGGSVLASDRIWRAVRRAGRRKPVIASMGNTAASGGYYVASAAHKILASPATVTGSIGVYSGKVSLAGLYRKLGINKQVIKRGRHADIYGLHRGWTKEEARLVGAHVRTYYRMFLSQVGRGRKLKSGQIDKLGRGRVWTGRQARERKLVDRFGGLEQAISLAKEMAKICSSERVSIMLYPNPPGLSRLLGRIRKFTGGDPLAAKVGDVLLNWASPLAVFKQGEPLALLPFWVDIR